MAASRAHKEQLHKALKPGSGTKQGIGTSAEGISPRQDKATGKKYNGPNYPDKATNIVVPSTNKGL